MSGAYSTHKIEGDVAVGRSVTAGGNATIRGHVKVGHNLRVEGWLEAPNIKDSLKGLFLTAYDLSEAYGSARRGDFAFVGRGFPAAIWVWNGERWVDTGETGGPEVDLSGVLDRYDQLIEEAGAKAQEALTKGATALEAAAEAKLASGAAQQKAETALERAEAALEAIGEITIPEAGREIVEFDRVLMIAPMVTQAGAPGDVEVVYVMSTKRFLAYSSRFKQYYSTWAGAEDYGDHTAQGVEPTGGKLYVNEGTGYVWSGGELTPLGGGVQGGGCECAPRLDELQRQIDELKELVSPTVMLMSVSPTIAEAGTTAVVKARWSVTRGGEDVTDQAKVEWLEPAPAKVWENSTVKEYQTALTLTEEADIEVKTRMTYNGKVKESTTKVSFVYPSYFGNVGPSGALSEADVKGLTKLMLSGVGTKLTVRDLDYGRACYAYPASRGDITSMVDGNGYPMLGSYTKSELMIGGVKYNVYVLTRPVTVDEVTLIIN